MVRHRKRLKYLMKGKERDETTLFMPSDRLVMVTFKLGECIKKIIFQSVTQAPREKENRDLKMRRRRQQRKRQKSNRLRLAKQQLRKCITLFCTFLYRHSMTTTWKYLISRFMEDVNKPLRNFLSLSELGYGFKEFSSKGVSLNLTK